MLLRWYKNRDILVPRKKEWPTALWEGQNLHNIICCCFFFYYYYYFFFFFFNCAFILKVYNYETKKFHWPQNIQNFMDPKHFCTNITGISTIYICMQIYINYTIVFQIQFSTYLWFYPLFSLLVSNFNWIWRSFLSKLV